MALSGPDNLFPLNESEYAYAYEAFKPVASGKTIKITVPKVTGNITQTGKISIRLSNTFVNASACKFTYTSKVTLINYISATVKENCNWLDKLNTKGLVPKDAKFNVEFVNGSVTNPRVLTS